MKRAKDISLYERFPAPALLVVDLQNDFVRPGAPLEVAAARSTLEKNRALIDTFRRAGLPVVFTRFVADERDALFSLWSPECQSELKCCWRGHRRTYQDTIEPLSCIDVVSELAPADGDLVIDKHSYGAFHGTELHQMLQARGVRSIVLTGTVTQICVEQTGREAFQLGYRVTIATDAVSSHSPALAEATLANFEAKFGWISTTQEILTALPSTR